jgi:serine/threonine protein kinase
MICLIGSCVLLDILIADNGVVKLGDFGLARICFEEEAGNMSHQVATRWYRSPELLYASRSYDYSVDIWAAGAIFAELFMLTPLFPGHNDIDQMFKVFQVMGTPDAREWPVSQVSSRSNFPN